MNTLSSMGMTGPPGGDELSEDTEFLVAMSHEMRTPLNAILGMTELVLESSLSAEQRGMIKRVHRAGEHLLSLVEDLLDISRIDAGQIALRKQPFDPADVVEEVAESLAERARERGITLIVDVGGVVKPVLGDLQRFTRVVSALADNAVKFTRTGSVVVRVEAGGPIRGVGLTIEDTGVGMSREMHQRAFDRFVRGDDSVAGTGLGLPIVRGLVTAMHGEVTLFDRPGGGTVARVQLPLDTGEALPPALETKPRVQLCDPLSERREALTRLLHTAGADVSVIADLADASDADVRVVAEDALLAGGIDAAVPTILVGASSSLRQIGDEVGAKAVVRAPLRRSELFSAIEVCLGRSEPERKSSYSELTLLRVLIAEDDPDNRAVISRTLQRAGFMTDVASDGPTALERMRQREYDAVVTDVEMPGLSGIELTRAIRTLERENGRDRTPIIVLTAYALPFVRQEALEAGADDFVSKPLRPDTFLQSLHGIMDKRAVVMVVDDDASSRALTKRLLERDGHRIVEAGSGLEAEALFGSRRVDLVLSDLEMPGMDGYALARRIRSADPDVALIAVTGHARAQVEDRCVANGYDRLLTKPFKRAALVEVVAEMLTPEEPPDARDAEAGELVDAPPEVEDLIPEFLGRRLAEIQLLRGAQKTSDYELIRSIAHRVRGSGGAYGFMQLTELATHIGDAARASDPDATTHAIAALEEYLSTVRVRLSDGRVLSQCDFVVPESGP